MGTDADRAKYLVMQAEEKKKQIILKAQGTEREAQLIGEAMKNNPQYAELKRIENAVEIAKSLSKSGNKVVLSAEGLMLNLLGTDGHNAGEAMLKSKMKAYGRTTGSVFDPPPSPLVF